MHAAFYSFILILIVVILVVVGFFTLNEADIPISVFECPTIALVASSMIVEDMPPTCTAANGIISTTVTFPVFLIALLSLIGW